MPKVSLHTYIPTNRAGRRRTATQTATLEVRKIRYYSNSRLSLARIKDDRPELTIPELWGPRRRLSVLGGSPRNSLNVRSPPVRCLREASRGCPVPVPARRANIAQLPSQIDVKGEDRIR
jgi:hypothetical protein